LTDPQCTPHEFQFFGNQPKGKLERIMAERCTNPLIHRKARFIDDYHFHTALHVEFYKNVQAKEKKVIAQKYLVARRTMFILIKLLMPWRTMVCSTLWSSHVIGMRKSLPNFTPLFGLLKLMKKQTPLGI